MRRLGAALLCALALSACGLQEDVAQKVGQGGGVGSQAPPLSGPTLDGGTWEASALHGHVAVVDFWASWCGPCRAQQPELDRLAAAYGPRGVVFVGVDIRDDPAEGRAYQQRFGVDYRSLSDPASALASAWDVPAPPSTLVVDAQGTVRQRVLGGVDAPTLGALLDRLLSGRPA